MILGLAQFLQLEKDITHIEMYHHQCHYDAIVLIESNKNVTTGGWEAYYMYCNSRLMEKRYVC